MPLFRIGNLGATIEAPDALVAVQHAMTEGRLRNGTAVHVWPESDLATRSVFQIHAGAVLTRAEYEATLPPLEEEP